MLYHVFISLIDNYGCVYIKDQLSPTIPNLLESEDIEGEQMNKQVLATDFTVNPEIEEK